MRALESMRTCRTILSKIATRYNYTQQSYCHLIVGGANINYLNSNRVQVLTKKINQDTLLINLLERSKLSSIFKLYSILIVPYRPQSSGDCLPRYGLLLNLELCPLLSTTIEQGAKSFAISLNLEVPWANITKRVNKRSNCIAAGHLNNICQFKALLEKCLKKYKTLISNFCFSFSFCKIFKNIT